MIQYVFLTKEFLDKYSNLENSQIVQKEFRPHILMKASIESKEVTFAIPLRSNITHKNAYIINRRNGIDYSKAVVIDPKADIRLEIPIIRNQEHKEIQKNRYKIEYGFKKFLNRYREEITLHPEKPENRTTAKFSTLQYFHKELCINHNLTEKSEKKKVIIEFEISKSTKGNELIR